MKVAVIGGGINGVMTAWALALKGMSVDLFEQGRLMGATSSASTKLLHGGLRYLEHGHLRLVREALHERQWWMIRAPHLAKPIRIMLPIYKNSGKPAWVVRVGLTLYDRLAGRASLGDWGWRSREEMLSACAGFRSEGLQGAFSFYDGQMDDYALGLWAAGKAREAGVTIHTETKVTSLSQDAVLAANGHQHRYDRIVNAAGPWAKQLLDASNIPSVHNLDLVRGSHLLIDCDCECALLVQSPSDGRICFILPYHGKTLVGTTEVRQELNEPVSCSAAEASYLQELFGYYFPKRNQKVCESFAGLRSLIRSNANPNKATREYVIEKSGKIVNVFGGKWTTARALGLRVADIVTSSR
ncbi:MAG: glycerol-3-phosphate dehydrogenase/oxidase [Terracidiphilus sp.]|jgi:glycerol-3-phosphate dehydrogenase